jgi:hypothetical protein
MPRISRDHHTTLSAVSDNLEVIERVKPPHDLSREQRDEFERVVAVSPADWFSPGNIAALTQYSRHVIAARRIAEAIETCGVHERVVADIKRIRATLERVDCGRDVFRSANFRFSDLKTERACRCLSFIHIQQHAGLLTLAKIANR